MTINNNIHIKFNLLNNKSFIVENNDNLIIYKSPKCKNNIMYFECYIIIGDELEKHSFMTDQLVYDTNLKKIKLLNTRRNLVTAEYNVDDIETIYIYSFDSNSILIIFDEDEKHREE